MSWRYVFNVTQTSVNKQRFWMALTSPRSSGGGGVYGCGLNRFVHEGMNTISHVKDHLKTRSGNVNIRKKQPLTTSYQRRCDVIDVDTTLFRWHVPAQGNILSIIMGIYVRKPVFGVSDKASFKPVSSATKTS